MSGTTADAVTTTEAVIAPVADSTTPAATTSTDSTKASEINQPGTKAVESVLTTTEEGKAEEKSEEGKATEVVYDIKAPEGMKLDPEAVSSFTSEVAKAVGLTNEQAQAVIDYGLKREMAVEQEMIAQATQALSAVQEAEWDALKKDPELGGLNWPKTQALAKEGFMKFASKEELEFVESLKLGGRGPMITLFRKIALAHKEGSSFQAGSSSGAGGQKSEDDLLREMYPTMFKER